MTVSAAHLLYEIMTVSAAHWNETLCNFHKNITSIFQLKKLFVLRSLILTCSACTCKRIALSKVLISLQILSL